MTRTTLDLDASVLEQLRRRAEVEGKSMGQVASERLAIGLGERVHEQAAPLGWPSKHMGRSRVNLEDKEALWQALAADRPDRGAQLDGPAR